MGGGLWPQSAHAAGQRVAAGAALPVPAGAGRGAQAAQRHRLARRRAIPLAGPPAARLRYAGESTAYCLSEIGIR